MEPDFWLQRWSDDRIGFHQEDLNPYLLENWPHGHDAQNTLVPLCGKTLDLRFLSEFGAVTGVELSDIAIRDFFEEWNQNATRSNREGISCTSANGVCLMEADFFNLPVSMYGSFSHAYDRAAMIALPPDTQGRYMQQLSQLLSPKGFVLSVTIEYPHREIPGPPFSISVDEMVSRAGPYFEVEVLESIDTWRPESRLAQEGISALQTHVFGLTKR